MVSDIIKLTTEYGLWGLAITLFSILLYKYTSVIIEKWTQVGKKKTKPPQCEYGVHLKYHQFFTNARYRLISDIPNLDIFPDKPVRQEMVRDMMHAHISALYELSLEFVSNDIKAWTTEQWANEATNLIGRVNQEFERRVMDEGMPKIIIEKYNRWRASTSSTVFEYINGIAVSKMYETNYGRTNTLLILFNLVLVTTIGNAEQTLAELNGEISGIKYKNGIIE